MTSRNVALQATTTESSHTMMTSTHLLMSSS